MPEKGVPKKPEGLLPTDDGYLNGLVNIPVEEKRAIYAQKRTQYAGDSVALQQIDVYDGETIYHDKLSEFISAIKSGNTQKQTEIESWMKEHYPDIG